MRAGLSVIIPVYNGAEYIRNTVLQICKSGYENIEIILVNDGSTDNSLDICKGLQKEIKNIKVIDKKNGGIVEARNTGLMYASCEYIVFCDQDDYVETNAYSLMMKRILETKADMVMCSTGNIIDGKKIPFEQLKDGIYDDMAVREKLLYSLMFRGYRYPERKVEFNVMSSIWKCITKKDLLINNNISFCRFINYEDDYLMMINLLCVAKRVVTMSRIGYYWLINPVSESHKSAYIKEYGKKIKLLMKYIEDRLLMAEILQEHIDIYKAQLVFQRMIDYIENVFNEANKVSLKEKINEINGYIEENKIFKINMNEVYPESGYHRLRVMYYLVRTKSKVVVLVGMNIFLQLEKILHKSHKVMRFLNAKKTKR